MSTTLVARQCGARAAGWRSRRRVRPARDCASTSTALPRSRATSKDDYPLANASGCGVSERAKQLDESVLEIQIHDLAQRRAVRLEVATHLGRPSSHQPLFANARGFFSIEHSE